MRKLARGAVVAAWLVAGAAALVACSSTSTNEASGGASSTGGASTGGASGASSGGASTGGAAGASSDGGGGVPASLVWCTKPTECAALCGALQPYCSPSGPCLCVDPGCQPGTSAGCPAGMTCNYDNCVPDGFIAEGQACYFPSKLCASGLICNSGNEVVDGAFNFRCRKPCQLASPPAGCTCQQNGVAEWGWCK